MFRFATVVFVLLKLVRTGKILVVVPTPSISHQVVFRPLIEELVNRDHEVTVITPDPVYSQGGAPNNLREIDVRNWSYTKRREWLIGIGNVDQDDFMTKFIMTYRTLSDIFREQLKDESIQNLITNKTQKFDVLILEACVNPALIFSHIFKAPVIQMSSFGVHPDNIKPIGGIMHPLLYPSHYQRRIYNLTILEKYNEVYNYEFLNRALEKQEIKDNVMLQRLFGNDIPMLSELKNNIHMLFPNTNPIWVHNQPVPSNLVYIWGIHNTPEKQLPKDLQSYLDSSNHGVIYISFGTNFNTSSMSAKTLKILLSVLSQTPYNVLWKWDSDVLPGKTSNIKIAKWFPQSDVLKHPNVKLFVTQGGLQSTDEAITAGVPLIGMPTLVDQEYNSEKYVYFKIGIKLSYKSVTVERFGNAIRTIFENYESYQKNIIQLRMQMQDQPKPPLENTIWWIEYVLRHGGAKQLRSPAANMSWTEYYEMELILILLSTAVVVVTALLLLLYRIFNRISTIISSQMNKTKLL